MLWFALLACTDEPSGPPAPSGPACGVDGTPDWVDPTPYPRDDELTLADLQARGTHNSYHQQPPSLVDPSYGYTQAPIPDQLEALGVRQLELDVHLRDDGGLDVFHLEGLDPLSSCPTFQECLQEVCVWSASNPNHVPITVWIEPKDDLDDSAPGYQPLLGHSAAIEGEILAVFPRDRVYAPDDWKRGRTDLGTATEELGAPTLAEVRGHLLFGLLDSGEHRDDYLAESPDLTGRLLFPATDTAADGFAAMVKDADPAVIPDLLAAGLVVTSNVDGVDDTDADNTARRDAALAAGVNYASSDLPAPVDGRDYWMELPGGDPVRCNPVSAPSDCVASDLE